MNKKNTFQNTLGTVNIISLSAIVILFGILGYFLLMKKQDALPKIIPTPTPAEESVLGTATNDWKTYRNEKVGIEFKYPLNFSLHQELVGRYESILNLVFVKDGTKFDKNQNAEESISFDVAEQQIAGTPLEFIDQVNDYMDIRTGKTYLLKEKIKISDNPLAYKLVFGNGEFGRIVTIRKDGKSTIWWNINWYNSPSYESFVEQMFTTLKFTK